MSLACPARQRPICRGGHAGRLVFPVTRTRARASRRSAVAQRFRGTRAVVVLSIEKQIQKQMRKRSRRGRRGHGSNLARGPSNASTNQYLRASAYAYGDGYVSQLTPRSQLSVQTVKPLIR